MTTSLDSTKFLESNMRKMWENGENVPSKLAFKFAKEKRKFKLQLENQYAHYIPNHNQQNTPL